MGLDYTHMYKTLSEVSRRRILAILEGNECSVQDIQDVLLLGQSSISAHLALLRSNGLVDFRRKGRFVFYRLAQETNEEIDEFFKLILESLPKEEWYEKDMAKLKKLLDQKAEISLSFYEGVEMQNKRSPGQTDHGLAIGLLRTIRGKIIVDIGCGVGRLANGFAKLNKKVIGIDADAKQVSIANTSYGTQRKNLQFIEGRGENTKQKADSVDMVIFSHSLHHIENPNEALSEAKRILKKGACLIILDLKAHEEHWTKKIYGDAHLGFSPEVLYESLEKIGFGDVNVDIDANDEEFSQFESLIVTAIKI